MNRSWFYWMGGLLLLLGFGPFALLLTAKVLPQISAAPTFNLIDQAGTTFSSTETSGQIALYAFLPVRNPNAPQTMGSLVQLQERLERAGVPVDRVRLVVISLDPDHDTPEVLTAFAAQYPVKPERWRFLTGSWVAVKLAASNGFGISFNLPQGQPDAMVTYQPGFRLVDPYGVVRAEYAGVTLPVDKVMADLDLLAQEESASGAQRLANAAAHLFSGYRR